MQPSHDDVTFEQWLFRALNDPSLPGVLDFSKCTVLRTRSSFLLTAEELRQLKLAMQSNSEIRVLKLCTATTGQRLLNVVGLSEIAEPLSNLTALRHLHLECTILILF